MSIGAQLQGDNLVHPNDPSETLANGSCHYNATTDAVFPVTVFAYAIGVPEVGGWPNDSFVLASSVAGQGSNVYLYSDSVADGYCDQANTSFPFLRDKEVKTNSWVENFFVIVKDYQDHYKNDFFFMPSGEWESYYDDDYDKWYSYESWATGDSANRRFYLNGSTELREIGSCKQKGLWGDYCYKDLLYF
jgi:hypothetical protein